MSLEYCKGYCQDCKTEHKLERQKPNHMVHFLITVGLGIFTYGIGSVVWMVVWYLVSVKFTHWSCHVCGGQSVEPMEHHPEHNNKNEKKNTHTFQKSEGLSNINIVEKLKESSKIIIGLLISIPLIIFLYSLAFNENDNDDTKDKQQKENIVNARVDIKDDDVPKKSTLKYNEVESGLCYIYDIEHDATSIKGLVSCKKGKLTLELYDSETKSVVETKTVPFNENKFYIKVDTPDKINFRFAIKLTKEQIEERQKQIKEKKIQSISSNDESNDKEQNNDKKQCSIKSWNHSKYSSEYLVVEGRTSCTKGKIILEIFDENNKSLGSETDYFESGVFSIFFQTNLNPTSITLKYTISQK